MGIIENLQHTKVSDLIHALSFLGVLLGLSVLLEGHSIRTLIVKIQDLISAI